MDHVTESPPELPKTLQTTADSLITPIPDSKEIIPGYSLTISKPDLVSTNPQEITIPTILLNDLESALSTNVLFSTTENPLNYSSDLIPMKPEATENPQKAPASDPILPPMKTDLNLTPTPLTTEEQHSDPILPPDSPETTPTIDSGNTVPSTHSPPPIKQGGENTDTTTSRPDIAPTISSDIPTMEQESPPKESTEPDLEPTGHPDLPQIEIEVDTEPPEEQPAATSNLRINNWMGVVLLTIVMLSYNSIEL